MKNTIGFIRVRRRTTKRGEAANYEIVRAVRVNGVSRHKFVLGLGTFYQSYPVWFWMDAIERMSKHGLSKAQRGYFAAACVRKGARLPTRAECKEREEFLKMWKMWKPEDARKLAAVRRMLA